MIRLTKCGERRKPVIFQHCHLSLVLSEAAYAGVPVRAVTLSTCARTSGIVLECHVREILARRSSIGTWMPMNDDSGDNFCGMEDLNESSRDKSASDVDWNSFYAFKVLKAIPIINENSSWWRRYIHAPTISTNLNIYTQSSLWTMWKVKSILHSTSFVKQRASSAHLFLSSALVMPSSKKR